MPKAQAIQNGLLGRWKQITALLFAAGTLFSGGWWVSETFATRDFTEALVAGAAGRIQHQLYRNQVQNDLYFWTRMQANYEQDLNDCLKDHQGAAAYQCEKVRRRLKYASDRVKDLTRMLRELQKPPVGG